MKTKPSEIFEGKDSSLKKVFDKAITPTYDTMIDDIIHDLISILEKLVMLYSK